ncbi:MAG TPA: bifunctional YncE family protein/alkaline phosphatase family protein [Trebonia sp.]
MHFRTTARRGWLIAGTLVGVIALGAGTAAAVTASTSNPAFGTNQVGTQTDGKVLLPDNQYVSPYGTRTTLTAQSIGTGLSPDGSDVAVQVGGDDSGAAHLQIVNASTNAVLQTFGGQGVAAPVYSPDGTALYAATLDSVLKYTVDPSTGLVTDPTSPVTISLPSGSDPYGLAVSADSGTVYAALNGTNKLGVIDAATGTLTTSIAVGNAPQGIAIIGDQAFVSNRGGRPAVAGDNTDSSDGTNIVTNPGTETPASGTVSVVNLGTNTQTSTINVGIEPTNITDHDGYLFVTNTNSDTVSIIDAATRRVVQTFNVNPLSGTKVGAYPNDVTFVNATHFLVSVKGDNSVAEFGYDGPKSPVQYEGLIPADWYPNQVTYDAKVGKVIVSNQQGVGTDGYEQTYKVLGTLTSFTPPSETDLGALTKDVFTDNAWNNLKATTAAASKTSGKGKGLPAVPTQPGQPSAIKHVFLIIKENRTYDQVLGDLNEGNGDSADTDYGEAVTPNEHALADDFTDFDNFYDSGMLSADGHNWMMQADPNDYLAQDSASDWARSYPAGGGDPLSYQQDGFVWNTVEAAGKTVKNYGEFDTRSSGSEGTWQQYYEDAEELENGSSSGLPYAENAYLDWPDVSSLANVTNEQYPEFNLDVPDQYRADVWLQDFDQQVKTSTVPGLTIMWVPNDHTGGIVSGDASVADNDLAVGRIVDAISHSKVWGSSAVFTLEDDSQAGDDHVDGHRAPLWIASPYAKRGVVNNTYYSQINVVKTIEQILGAKPMNQEDEAAVPMYDAFTNTPDDAPYNAVANQTPLTQGLTASQMPTGSFNDVTTTSVASDPTPQTSTTPTKAQQAAALIRANSSTSDNTDSTTTAPSNANVPAADKTVAAAWAAWYGKSAETLLTGTKALADSANPAQLNRYDWYTSTGWSKPYPGDKTILAPDQVPGRNLAPGDLDG